MSQYVVVRNPWQPSEYEIVSAISPDMTLADIPDFGDLPYIIIADGKPLLRAEWHHEIREYQCVVVSVLPQGGDGGSNPLQIVMMLAVAAVSFYVPAAWGAWGAVAKAGIMIAGSMLVNVLTPTPSPTSAMQASDMAAASPTYSLTAQGNAARLGAAIPVQYGRMKAYPDFAAYPYSEFSGNDQYLFQLFCLGCGYFSIESILIEDTPISSFDEITYEVIEPSGTCTLFPTNVITSAEVAGQELLTGEYVGFFVASAPETSANFIGIDFIMSKGMFYANDTGGLDAVSITVRVEAQTVDMYGVGYGPVLTLATESWSMATNTPQRISTRYSVTPGRYQVRCIRTDTKQTDSRYGHEVAWAGMRSYLPNTTDFGNVTLIAMRMRATNNLSQQSSRKINVIATRKLPIWNGTTWSAPTATRSIAWSIADALRDTDYGLSVADSRIDLATLLALDAVWAGRTEYFDARFDSQITAYEALSKIALVGRSRFFTQGGTCRVARDSQVSIPVAMFTERNIKKGSFSIDYQIPTEETSDTVELTYWDAQVWSKREVKSDLPGAAGDKIAKCDTFGITSRDHAYHYALYLSATNRYRRRIIKFSTEMEGFIPSPLDLIAIQHSMPGWSQQCEAVAWDNEYLRLTVTEDLVWGSGQHFVGMRKADGSMAGPYLVSKGTADNIIVFSELPSYIPVTSDEQLSFGENLLSHQTDLDQSVWSKSGSPVIAQELDGDWTITDNNPNAYAFVSQKIYDFERLVHSVLVKKDAVPRATRFAGIYVHEVSGGSSLNPRYVKIDTSTGESSTNSSTYPNDSFLVEDYGGYWRVSIAVTPLSESLDYVRLLIYPAVGSGSWPTAITTTGSATFKDFRVGRLPKGMERTHIIFGEDVGTIQYAKVLSVKPNSQTDVTIEAVNEDNNVHTAETGSITPPVITSTLVTKYTIPVVSELNVTVGGGPLGPEVFLSWRPAAGAEYYVVDSSADGDNWSRLTDTTTASARAVVWPGWIYLRVAAIGMSIGPYVEWSGDLTSYLPPPAPPSNLALEQPFVGRSCKIAWTAAARSDLHRVEVWVGGTKKRTIDVSATRYEYTEEDATSDGGPWRSLQFRVYGLGNGVSTDYATLDVSNPQVSALDGVTFVAGYLQIVCTYSLPSDTDFQGVIVAMSKTDGFTPVSGNYAYDGPDKLFVLQKDPDGASFVNGDTWYIKIAGYDKFGKDSLNWSSQHFITIVDADADLTPEEVLERLNSSFTQGNVILNGSGSIIAYDGASSIPNRDFVLMSAGLLTYQRYRDGQYREYMGLRRVEYGVAESGATVTLPGWWDGAPKIITSPYSLSAYNASYPTQSQAWACSAEDIREDPADSGIYKFEAVAELTLSASSGSTVYNQASTSSSNSWTSSEYDVYPNLTSLTVNVSALSVRGTGAHTFEYYYRAVTATVWLYSTAGGWVQNQSTSLVIGATTTTAKTGSVVCTSIPTDTTKLKVVYAAADAGGTFSTGSDQYNYSSYTAYGSGVTTLHSESNGWASATYSLSSYSPPGGYEVYQVSYQVQVRAIAGGAPNPVTIYLPNGDYKTTGPYSYQRMVKTGSAYTWEYINYVEGGPTAEELGASWWTINWSSYWTSFNPSIVTSANAGSGQSTVGIDANITNGSAVIYMRQLITNNTTPSNTYNLVSSDWGLTGKMVLSTGSLNYIAVL